MGMTFAQVRAALPGASFSHVDGGDYAAYVEVKVGGEALMELGGGGEDADKPIDWTRPVEWVGSSHPSCRTPEGIHPGSTVREAVAAYGPVLKVDFCELGSREYVAFARGPKGLLFRGYGLGRFKGRSGTTRHYDPDATLDHLEFEPKAFGQVTGEPLTPEAGPQAPGHR